MTAVGQALGEAPAVGEGFSQPQRGGPVRCNGTEPAPGRRWSATDATVFEGHAKNAPAAKSVAHFKLVGADVRRLILISVFHFPLFS